MRSTTCYKNDIAVSDYAEFEHFEKFGTDYFFKQNENDQRAIFINLLKSQLPDYDVQTAQLEVKSLQKSQRETQAKIKELVNSLRDFTDVEVLEISKELEDAHLEYKKFVESSTRGNEQASEINKKNNVLLSKHNEKKTELLNEINSFKNLKQNHESNILSIETKIKEVESEALTKPNLTDVSNLKNEISKLETKLKI